MRATPNNEQRTTNNGPISSKQHQRDDDDDAQDDGEGLGLHDALAIVLSIVATPPSSGKKMTMDMRYGMLILC